MQSLGTQAACHQAQLRGWEFGRLSTEKELGMSPTCFATCTETLRVGYGGLKEGMKSSALLVRLGDGQASVGVVHTSGGTGGFPVSWDLPKISHKVKESVIFQLVAKNPTAPINSWFLCSVHREEREILQKILESPSTQLPTCLSQRPTQTNPLSSRLLSTVAANPEQTMVDCEAGVRNIMMLGNQPHAELMIMLEQLFNPSAGYLCDSLTISSEAQPYVVEYLEHLTKRRETRLRNVFVFGGKVDVFSKSTANKTHVSFFTGLPKLHQSSLKHVSKFTLRSKLRSPEGEKNFLLQVDGTDVALPLVLAKHSEVLKRLLETEDSENEQKEYPVPLQPSKAVPLETVVIMVSFLKECACSTTVQALVRTEKASAKPTAPWCPEFECFAWRHLNVHSMGPRWLQLVELMELAVYLDMTSLKLFCRSSMITEFQLRNMGKENASLLDAMLPLQLIDADSRGKRNRDE